MQATQEVTDMVIPGWKTIRAMALAAASLLAGCVVVPDGSDGYHGNTHGSTYVQTYVPTYGPGYYSHARPPAPAWFSHRPPPTVIVRPRPVVVVPAPRAPAFGYRGHDHRPPHVHGGRGGHDRGERGERGDDRRGRDDHGNGHGRGGR